MFVAIANFSGRESVLSWIGSCFDLDNVARIFPQKESALNALANCPPLPVARKYDIPAKTYDELLELSPNPDVAYPLAHPESRGVCGFLFRVSPEQVQKDNSGVLVYIDVTKTPRGHILSGVDCYATTTARWYFSERNLHLLWLCGREEKLICCGSSQLLKEAEENLIEFAELFSLAKSTGEWVDSQEVDGIEVSLFPYAISLTIVSQDVSLGLWTLCRPYFDAPDSIPLFYDHAEFPPGQNVLSAYHALAQSYR